ncbi:very short patch repair endonuclease [Ruminococcus albus]|nr:very short patch repair endonuclease [Ruminococcus albus]
MSRIRSVNSKPELLVRKYLFSKGFRYVLNDKRYPGKPDIVLPKYKTVIFVNGCFWHKHDCGRFVWPKSNIEYWRTKITRNVERDNANYIKLSEMGWNVIVLWECQLKKDTMTKTLDELSFQLKKSI